MADPTLVQITTHSELMEVWPYVKKGIERIKARDKSCGSWTHHNIFNAVRFGLPTAQPKTTAVELHVAVKKGHTMPEFVGFMVTMPKIDPFRGNLPVGIVVWLLYADFELIEKFLPYLERLCRANGGDEIEFQTGRQGWIRKFPRLAKLGFKIQQYKIVKAVA